MVSAVDRFVSGLYAPPNEAVLKTAFDPWLDRLRDGSATLLPVRRDGVLTLYGLTPDAAAGRGLAEELLAAVGPSWSDFEGAASLLDPDDPIEARILVRDPAVAPGPVLRLVIRPGCEAVAWKAVERLGSAWSRRPAPSDEDVLLAPLQDVLRDVELALQISAVDEAARLIEALRRRGELDSRNLLFLDLRLLAASGRWNDVLRHPRLDDVLNARRPIGVTVMLFDALDARYFGEAAAADDAEAALRIHRTEVAPRFDRLVAQAPDVASVSVLQVRILEGLDAGATREETVALATRGDATARAWLEALARLAPDTAGPATADVGETGARPSAVDAAREALYSGDHAAALELLDGKPASREAVELALAAAAAIGTPTAARIVATGFDALAPEQQKILRRHPLLAAPLTQALALASAGEAVASWSQWLALLASDEPFADPLVIAEAGAVEWPADEPADAADAEALAHALTSLPTHAREVLERALPYLLAYLERRRQPDDLALPVLGAILAVLAYGDSRTRAVREAILGVLDPLLDGSPPTDVYDEVIESIEAVWADVRAPKALSWLTDVVALLVAYPCPSPARRASLIRSALNDAFALRDVDPGDVEVLRVVAEDPVLNDAFAAEVDQLAAHPVTKEAPEQSELMRLDPGDLTVGIYTLSPTAARHAIAVLSRRYPSLEFEVSEEKDGSPLLRGFAQRADVLACVVASAKHAATGFIRQHCRPEAFMEIGTKGSTALVKAISDRLDELAAA